MFTTPEQFAAANKSYIDAMLTIANTTFASAERLAALNLSTARAVLEDSVINAKVIMSSKDPQEMMGLQASMAQPIVEKAVAYSRSVWEIMTQTQEELSKIAEAQMSEVNQRIAAALEKVAQSGPGGSEGAVAAVKSAIAAANSAYESMNKAARQVADMAEANVAAATSATVKAVGAAAATTPKTKKSA